MKRTVLALLLAATPALGQEFGGALPPLKFGVPLPAPPDMPAIRSRAVLRRPAPPETARPDAFDDADGFRAALLASGERWLVSTAQGDVLLVVERGYLDGAALDRLAADLQEGVAGVPRVTGRRSRIPGRFTVYVYDQGPLSEADVPGAQPGEKGLMLRFVKEQGEPLFHELTHLLAGYSESQSLGEGIADVVQSRFRPGRASGFKDAGVDPDAKARAAFAAYGAPFLETIGAPGYYRFSAPEVRFDFYYCSWSFAKFLVARAPGMAGFWRVADAGGTDESYRAVYGKDRAALVAEWVTATSRATR
jgi:hypothetical protein